MDAHIRAEMNLPKHDVVASEIARYQEVQIPEGTPPVPADPVRLANRRPMTWHEPMDGLPQNLYFTRVDDLVVFGRKLISPLKLAGELEELTCSRIDAVSIIGVHLSHQVHEGGYTVHYVPLGPGEKVWLFSRILADPLTEITFPFTYLVEGKERRSPTTGWAVDEGRADNLGTGERVLREYTLRYLRSRHVENAILFDPACSTGQFLAEIQQEFPRTTTIGQDLSPDMVRLAGTRLDRVICDDAIRPGVPDWSVDYMFVRFLNSEVVTTTCSMDVFRALEPKLAEDGRLIVLGHTPILPQLPFFRQCGLAAEQCTGSTEDGRYVFQYYVLRRST